MTNNAYIRQLDPIQGLVDYVEDIKPYHTKIIEVMIEYVYTDATNAIVSEELGMAWGPSQAVVASILSGGLTFTISGDWTAAIFPGDNLDWIYTTGSPGDLATLRTTTTAGSDERLADTIVYDAMSNVTTITFVTIPGSPATAMPDTTTKVEIPGDVTRFFTFVIESIDTTNNTITVSGPATADIFNGQQIDVNDTTSNDGTYTIEGSPTFNGLSTILPVAETLTAETIGAGSPTPTITPVRYFVP